jgi:hypothetical protein
MGTTMSNQTQVVAPNDFFLERPQYKEGYDEKTNTVVRLVSPSKKGAKAYKVTNIDDVASKNNWKAWLYLAPALILVVIFLVYPLINTVFISFFNRLRLHDGNYFSGLTLDNFGIILGSRALSTGSRDHRTSSITPSPIPS